MARRSDNNLNIGRSTPMRFLHASVDFFYIALMMLLLLVAIYSKMDTDTVYQGADPKRWIQYKPELPDDIMSFEELQERNPDVKAWLTIYGTNIDYPVLFKEDDNFYYLNHNSLGENESSGSIYIDGRNKPDFTDFNTIIHGHHMARHEMFGDLDRFADPEFFKTHEFGNLYYNEKDYGIQILITVLTDGYDASIYRTGTSTIEDRLEYINNLYAKAKLIRGVDLSNRTESVSELQQGITSPITPNDRLLVFSTCNLSETNGRYIVVAKLLDHPVANPYPETEIKKNDNGGLDTYSLMNKYGSLPIWVWIGLLVLIIIIVFILYRISRWRDRRRNENDEKH